MSAPWDGWYHCIGTTYGTWLHGDERGFRTRQHREHVEGDYRNPPPPGTYARLERHATRAMKHPPVVLAPPQQQVVCRALGERLMQDAVQLAALVIAPTHFHALCRFPDARSAVIPGLSTGNALQDGRDPVPRHLLGRAKKHAAHTLAQAGLKASPGPLWARRTQVVAIRGRAHQLQVVRYIRRHEGVQWQVPGPEGQG